MAVEMGVTGRGGSRAGGSAGVSSTERAVVDMAIALVDGSDPRLHVPRLVAAGPPTGLSRPALSAIERVFARGVGRAIAAGGGERSPWSAVDPGAVDPGAGAPAPMRFSSAALDLVHWLHTAPVGSSGKDRVELVLRSPIGPADAVLFARAVELVDATGGPLPPALARSPWTWLFAGERLARRASVPELDWAPVHGDGGWLLDAMPRRLLSAWAAWARAVRAGSVQETTEHGNAQERVLAGYLAGCAARPDRAAFLVELLAQLAALPHAVWRIGRGDASLKAWQQARWARVALLRTAAAPLCAWEAQWRSVGFVDDGFDEAQRNLRRFEPAFSAIRSLAGPLAEAGQLPDATEPAQAVSAGA